MGQALVLPGSPKYSGGPTIGAAAQAPWSFLYGNQIVLCQQKYESKTQMLHISAQCRDTPTYILFFLFYWKLLKRIPTIFLHVRKLLSILAIQKWWIGGNCHFFVTFWRFSIFGILARKIFIKNHTSFNISIVAKIVKIDELNSDPKSNKIISQEAF